MHRHAFAFVGVIGLVLLASCDSDSVATTPTSTASQSSSSANNSGGSVNSGAVITDSRDGTTYRTVVIGTQTWMAENLNFRVASAGADTVGVCYSKSTDSCAKYGRLYTWVEAMGLTSSSEHTVVGGTLSRKGICPSGWHVPSDSEWTVLQKFVDNTGKVVGNTLKSKTDWGRLFKRDLGTGTDNYGFHALPGGYSTLGQNGFNGVGDYGYWWSATENGDSYAWNRIMDSFTPYVGRQSGSKTTTSSVRCVKD